MAGRPKHDDHRWFGGRLRELRTAAGWSRPDMEIASGIPAATLADLESGRRLPGWETALRVAEALGVSLDEFRKPPRPSTVRPIVGRPRRRRWGKVEKKSEQGGKDGGNLG
jgi:transcriptional regulator with XRE-family HTH domain